MDTKINAVIVEDSRLARNELKELLKPYKNIKLLGEAENVDNAYKLIIEKKPDILFLDINMPEKDGFELLEMLDNVPTTIFTTAYDEYAIKSFEYNAFDYLLKPINEKRFERTINNIIEDFGKNQEEGILNDINKQIFIKDGEKCWLVKLHDIFLFETVGGNYTKIHFNENKPLLYKSLNQLETKLPTQYFFRVNRQQIINLDYIKDVTPWFSGKLKITLKNNDTVEVSRRQSYEFKNLMSL